MSRRVVMGRLATLAAGVVVFAAVVVAAALDVLLNGETQDPDVGG